MWPKQVVLVRHSESDGNLRSTDENSLSAVPNHGFDVTEKGEKRALVTGRYLRRNYEFDAFFVSTFKRSPRTMKLMFPEVKPREDSRLNEMWRGIWYALTNEELRRLHPEEVRIRERDGWYHYRPLGGQSGQDIELMIYSFLADLREFYGGKRVLIVGHGTWMIYFWRIMCGRSIEEAEERHRSWGYHNTSVTVYEAEGDSMKLVLDDYLPEEAPSAPEIPKPYHKKWYEPRTSRKEVEKVAGELAEFMRSVRWWGLLGKLAQSKERLRVYSYDDACDMHEAIYLSGDGFVNSFLNPVTDLVEIVEGFMTNVFYGAESDSWNRSQERRPSQLIPWLKSLCQTKGV